jgi:poly(A) polymerase
MKKECIPCLDFLDGYRDRLYVAGGPVRDLFLGRETSDVDIVVPRALGGLPAEFAKGTGGRYVLLHDEKNQLTERVVIKGEPPCVFDFTRMQGASIAEDLSLRDFSINAMALTLGDWLEGRKDRLIDPHGGRRAIRERRVSVVSGRSLPGDPLRILRAYRLAAELRFRICPDTLQQIRVHRHLLKEASGERIREEFFRILSCLPSHPIVVEMDRAGILEVLFPGVRAMKEEGQTRICGADPWKQALARLRAIETLMGSKEDYFGRYAGELGNYLNEEVAGGRKKAALIKLAVVFFVDSPAGASAEKVPGDPVLRLKLSRREDVFLRMIPRRLRELDALFRAERVSRRDAALFFSGNESDYPGLFLLYLAGAAAFRKAVLRDEKEKILKMLLWHEKEIGPALQSPPLVDGRDLMDFFHLKPGPVIGRVLRALREAQLEGTVGNRRQALVLAGELLKK